MPTNPPSMAATNPLHHRRCMRIAVSFHPLRSRLGPTLVGRAGEPAHVTDMSITNAAHLSEPLAPNAGHQARRTAGARHERTLFAVAWMPWLGQVLAGKTPQASSSSASDPGFPCSHGRTLSYRWPHGGVGNRGFPDASSSGQTTTCLP